MQKKKIVLLFCSFLGGLVGTQFHKVAGLALHTKQCFSVKSTKMFEQGELEGGKYSLFAVFSQLAEALVQIV